MKKIERVILWAVVIGSAIVQAIQYIVANAPAN